MSDQDILKCKIGSLYDYINTTAGNSKTDDDPNFAYQKQLIDTQKSLMGMLGTMKPMMKDGKELMETFQQMFGQ